MEQPAPIPNASKPLWETVIEKMTSRNLIGIERYKTALQSLNGRDMLRDAADEQYDNLVYLEGAIQEWDHFRGIAFACCDALGLDFKTTNGDEVAEAIRVMKGFNLAAANRIAAQSELLSKKAES